LGGSTRCVVSVAMLTEGWDANTVTHAVDRLPIGAPSGVCVSPVLGSAAGAQMEAIEKERGDRVMSQKEVEVTRLTSVQLLDAAIWREIGTEEPQPAPAFLEALAALVERWLLVRSAVPEMDAVTVLCKARGYIARHGLRNVRQPLEHADEQELRQTG
jgi:hypothetical protein